MLTRTSTGWTVFLGALGMMAGLEAVDVSKMADWAQATSPAFVGTALAHFAVVAAAFVAGKIVPIDPLEQGRRGTDPNSQKPTTGTGSGAVPGGVSPATTVDPPKEP